MRNPFKSTKITGVPIDFGIKELSGVTAPYRFTEQFAMECARHERAARSILRGVDIDGFSYANYDRDIDRAFAFETSSLAVQHHDNLERVVLVINIINGKKVRIDSKRRDLQEQLDDERVRLEKLYALRDHSESID